MTTDTRTPTIERRLFAGMTADGKRLDLTIRIEDRNGKGPELSITDTVYAHGRDVGGGQCSDTLTRVITNIPPTSHRDTLERIAAIWDTWHLNGMNAACQHQRAAGWNSAVKLDPNGSEHSQDNMAIWTRPEDHPLGLLTRPCWVCGYRYGTAWLHEELPADVIAFVENLPTEADSAGTEQTLEEFCEQEIEIEATYQGRTTNADGWEHDAWVVSLRRGQAAYERVPFRVGTAHSDPLYVEDGAMGRREVPGWTPTEPTAYHVIECLYSDVEGLDQSFENWCAERGFNSDSRTAERIYHACLETLPKLQALMGENYGRFTRA